MIQQVRKIINLTQPAVLDCLSLLSLKESLFCLKIVQLVKQLECFKFKCYTHNSNTSSYETSKNILDDVEV